MRQASDQFCPRGGPLLHVDDAGGAGIPVLFLHGLCGDARQTAEVFPRDEAWRRITLEARGHGSSDAGDLTALSIATFAQDAAELIEARGIAPVIAGGISMGAAIAMRLAVTRPELLRGLIVARPAWSTVAAPANMRPNAEVGALLNQMSRDKARQYFMQGETARRLAKEAPDNLASLQGFFSREPQSVTAALLMAISADGPGVTHDQLNAIAIPTLVIGHSDDHVHPLSMAEEISAAIPHARLVRITAKAHNKSRYVSDFQTAMHDFLKGFL
jgi:pimeloyl-ACP methyl ester carboxylesterase